MASLRQLEYFAEVAEVGSLRQAAQRLGVTQPTLTVQLRALEEALGVVLFERTRNATLLPPLFQRRRTPHPRTADHTAGDHAIRLNHHFL